MNIGLCNLVHCKDGFLKHWTFTTAIPIYDKRIITRNFTDFIRRLERVLRFKPIYMAVLEEHDSDLTTEGRLHSYHVHCLFFNLPYFPHHEIVNIWKLGLCWVTPYPVEDGYNALRYILKYLTKESTLNDRVMLPRSILRPVVYYNLPMPTFTPIYKNATFILEADVTITTALFKKN